MVRRRRRVRGAAPFAGSEAGDGTAARSLEEAFWNPDPEPAPPGLGATGADAEGEGSGDGLGPDSDLLDPNRLVRVYVLGDRIDVDDAERERLADWVEARACRACRDELHRSHDPARLAHDDCRTALRAGRVLRRG